MMEASSKSVLQINSVETVLFIPFISNALTGSRQSCFSSNGAGTAHSE